MNLNQLVTKVHTIINDDKPIVFPVIADKTLDIEIPSWIIHSVAAKYLEKGKDE